jgi:hypothetical protein
MSIVTRNVPDQYRFELFGSLIAGVIIYKTSTFCDRHKEFFLNIELSEDNAYLYIPSDTFRKVQDNSNFFALASD